MKARKFWLAAMAAMACWSAQAQSVKPVKMVIGPDGMACELSLIHI